MRSPKRTGAQAPLAVIEKVRIKSVRDVPIGAILNAPVSKRPIVVDPFLQKITAA
jgi:hypothetical protein